MSSTADPSRHFQWNPCGHPYQSVRQCFGASMRTRPPNHRSPEQSETAAVASSFDIGFAGASLSRGRGRPSSSASASLAPDRCCDGADSTFSSSRSSPRMATIHGGFFSVLHGRPSARRQVLRFPARGDLRLPGSVLTAMYLSRKSSSSSSSLSASERCAPRPDPPVRFVSLNAPLPIAFRLLLAAL
jgi:hypothetical protein